MFFHFILMQSDSFMDKLSGTLTRKKKPQPQEDGHPGQLEHEENEADEVLFY